MSPPPVDTTVAPAEEHPFLRLVDKKFFGADVTVDGVPREMVEDTELTVWFQRNGGRDGVVWTGGCNSSGGPVVVSSNRLDVTHDGASSTVGCSEEHHAQDDWFTGFVVSDPAWALDGGVLTLSSGGTVVVLHERP